MSNGLRELVENEKEGRPDFSFERRVMVEMGSSARPKPAYIAAFWDCTTGEGLACRG